MDIHELAKKLGVEAVAPPGGWPPKSKRSPSEIRYDQNRKRPSGHRRQNRKRRVYDRDNGICQLCGKYVPFSQVTMDRIVPGALGGSYAEDNLQSACSPCNQRKGDKQLPRFAFRSEISGQVSSI